MIDVNMVCPIHGFAGVSFSGYHDMNDFEKHKKQCQELAVISHCDCGHVLVFEAGEEYEVDASEGLFEF